MVWKDLIINPQGYNFKPHLISMCQVLVQLVSVMMNIPFVPLKNQHNLLTFSQTFRLFINYMQEMVINIDKAMLNVR